MPIVKEQIKHRQTLFHISDWKFQRNAITDTYMRLKVMSFKTCQVRLCVECCPLALWEGESPTEGTNSHSVAAKVIKKNEWNKVIIEIITH